MENSEVENEAAEVEMPPESTSVEDMKAHVSELTEKLNILSREKQELEEDFGLKRAQLKGLFLQKEEELKQERELRCSSDEVKSQIEEELKKLRDELDEARSQIMITECTKENEIEAERRKCREEVATLNQLLKESVEEANIMTRNKYYSEIKRLLAANNKLEAELQEVRSLAGSGGGGAVGGGSGAGDPKETLLGPNVLSVVTKTLARKVGGLTPAGGGGSSGIGATLMGGGGGVSSSTESLQENLEDSMRKAQEDAEVLRSLVVPLEEEIKALKDKLRAADDQLRMYENTQSKIIKSSQVVGDLLKGKPLSEVVSELDDKLREVSSDLEVEKASRADLEMYVAILNTQKTVLQEDCDRLRTELKEMCRHLEEERRAHSELKHTWQRANDQFLEAQRLQIQDMHRMQGLLTADQVKTLAEMKQKDEEELSKKRAQDKRQLVPTSDKEGDKLKRGLSPIFGRLSPARTSPIPMVEQENKEKSGADVSDIAPASLDLLTSDDPMMSIDLGALEKTPGETQDPPSLDSLQDPTQRLAAGDLSLGHQRWSPEKLPGLTEAQYRALSDMTPELDARKATMDLARNSYSSFSIPTGKRLVSEREWMLLQEEVRRAREKVGQRCVACASWESQLHKANGALKESEKERKVLQNNVDRYKEDLVKEWDYRKEMEEKWNGMGEEYKKEVSELCRSMEEAEKLLKICQQESSQAISEVQKQVQKLSYEREKVQKDLDRLQKENDMLIGKHTISAEELQNEVIDLPNSVEDLQVLVLKYREELITAKIAKEHCKETMSNDNYMLQSQVIMERQEKEELSNEIDRLRDEVGILQSIRSQMDDEQQQRQQVESSNKELSSCLSNTESRHKQIVAELQRQLEDHRHQQAKLNNEIVELRAQAATLQKELDNSEAVQKDFVRLSQTLQMQLEKLREEEKELRWQHEDDVEECNNCKSAFNVTRRKHHCRHCGRIFCTECLSHTVESGPNKRSARVCDVCHTLLVKDTPPYFSTEIPHTPD